MSDGCQYIDERGIYHSTSVSKSDLQRDRWVSEHLPRWMNQVYAFVMGYFWLTCGGCGRYFGGHERSHASGSIYKGGGRYEVVCPRCAPMPKVREWLP